jgi:hypothetical protein
MLTDVLPFFHPLWQCLGIVLGFAALRAGLVLRRRRRQPLPDLTRTADQQRHVWLGKACWWTIGSGYLLGLVELLWVRGEPIMRSGHFYFATLALGLFCWGGLYGLAMLRGTPSYAACREWHGFLVPLALLLMVVVGLLGLPLLP